MIELIRTEMDRHQAAMEAILKPAAEPSYRPLRGVWVDVSPDTVFTKDVVEFLRGNFDVLAFMIEGLDEKFRWSTADASVAKLTFPTHERICTFWPSQYGDGLAVESYKAAKIAFEMGCSALELDLEMNWHGRNMDDVNTVAEAVATAHLDLDVTTVPYHKQNSVEADFAVRRQAVQAYTTASRRNTAGLRPHELPKIAHERALKTGAQQVCIGLAAWDQTKFEEGPRAAMTTAYKTALSCRPTEIRHWSLKHILRNQYARDFIELDVPELLELT